jgi:hypothetical protein
MGKTDERKETWKRHGVVVMSREAEMAIGVEARFARLTPTRGERKGGTGPALKFICKLVVKVSST